MNKPRLIQVLPKPQPSGLPGVVRFINIIPNNYVDKARMNKSIIFLILGLFALGVIYVIKKRCRDKMSKLIALPDFNKIEDKPVEEPSVLPGPESTRGTNEIPEESHEDINNGINQRNLNTELEQRQQQMEPQQQMQQQDNSQQLPQDLAPQEMNPTFPKDTCSLNNRNEDEGDLFGNEPSAYEGWGEFSNF